MSSKNSHQMIINQPTNMFHPILESSDQGQSDGTWSGEKRTLQLLQKWPKRKAATFAESTGTCRTVQSPPRHPLAECKLKA